MYDNIMHMINNKSTVDMIYLDFSKAFDKVDHGILLHKLRDLCITGRLGLWFFHFLFEYMIINRIAPYLDQHLIKEHVGFRPGNHTQVNC